MVFSYHGSLYSNIDHTEGPQACFEKLEKRKKKGFPALLLEELVLIVLKYSFLKLLFILPTN